MTEDTDVFSGQGIAPTDNPDDYVILRRKQGGDFFSVIDACVGETRVRQLEAVPTGNEDLFEGEITYADGHTGYVIVNCAGDIVNPVRSNGTSIQGYYAYLELDQNQEVVTMLNGFAGGGIDLFFSSS